MGLAGALALGGCGTEPIEAHGQFGTAIALATGDASPLPRLVFIDEGCPGPSAAGGCPATGDRTCAPLLVDSLATITAFRDESVDPGEATVDAECFEVRPADGLAVADPTAEALDAAVAHFRFEHVPVVRAPADGAAGWTWAAGDESAVVEPGGVIGGNLLRALAISIRTPRGGTPELRVYSEFPGSESRLADQGRAYLPLQFPGRLLGRDDEDRCRVDGSRCELTGYDLRPGQGNTALEATRMVIDACIAAPPCTLRYRRAPDDPFTAGSCKLTRGQGTDAECDDASRSSGGGGRSASLVVATGVPGIVLFDDSAVRMFGDLEALPECATVGPDDLACRLGNDGALAFSGWPDAGFDVPLLRLAVRSLALLPGSVSTRDVGPCERVDRRLFGLHEQCDRWARAARSVGDIRDTLPPFSGASDENDGSGHRDDPSATSLVVLGETSLDAETSAPDASRWLTVRVLPATHPLPLAVRRDVAPEALQPDGLLGAALFDDTEAILDYTDPNPGLRVRCVDPRAGACVSVPECREDGQAACCYGLPLDLFTDYIVAAGDDTCCGALSAAELEEVQGLGHCQGLNPP